MHKKVAWALGIVATLYLAFALYAWTVLGLGIDLPFSRLVPFPPYEWLLDGQQLTQIVVGTFLALLLLFVVASLRHRRFELRIPRWGIAVAALLLVAVVTELSAFVWQNFIWDPDCPGCPLEDKIPGLYAHDVVEYVAIVAYYVRYWCLVLLIAGALAASRPIDADSNAPATLDD